MSRTEPNKTQHSYARARESAGPRPPRTYTQAELESALAQMREKYAAKREKLEAELAELRAGGGPVLPPEALARIEADLRATYEPKLKAIELHGQVAAYLHAHNVHCDLAAVVMTRCPPETRAGIPAAVEEARRECPDLFERAQVDTRQIYRPDWRYVTGRDD